MSLIIFGATGDLVKAKILPALSTLGIEAHLYGRKDMDLPNYIKGELGEIKEKLADKDFTHAYVALPPAFFDIVLDQLAALPQVPRIALEKPFGSSHEHAEQLIELIKKLGLQEKIYLVDHYLGKPAMVELLDLPTAERQKIIALDSIDHVELDAVETNTIAGRGAFYDAVGTIKDFVQNHVLAMLSTLLMQEGCEVKSTLCRQKVLEQLQFEPQSLICGQYQGFKETADVRPDSVTETYVSLTLKYNNHFPVQVRTGKALVSSGVTATIFYKDGSSKVIDIQRGNNAYEAVLGDFLSNSTKLSLSFEEASRCWGIAEEIIAQKVQMLPIIYPQGSHPDQIN
jgi:glucose-6-phosphate 1-dehydrogenase